MVLGTLAWPSILVGAAAGAILGVVLGLPAASAFQPAVDRFTTDLRRRLGGQPTGPRPLDGIWRSSYEYTTAEQPGETLVDEHFLELRERRGTVLAMSVPRATGSALSLSLGVDGSVLTGTWREHTPSRRSTTARASSSSTPPVTEHMACGWGSPKRAAFYPGTGCCGAKATTSTDAPAAVIATATTSRGEHPCDVGGAPQESRERIGLVPTRIS